MWQVLQSFFFPGKYENSHTLCINCDGKSCTAYDGWEDCQDWTDEKCKKVSASHEKLAIQKEKKEERKAKYSSSSFSGFISPSVMPIPSSSITSDSFDNAVTMTNTTPNVCTTTFFYNFTSYVCKT